MLQKAFRAREHFHERREPVPSDAQHDDELSIFGGKTRLVGRHGSSASLTIAPATPQSQPIHPTRNQTTLNQRQFTGPQQAMVPETHATYPSNYLDNLRATFADLSGGWDGLFHEVPGPSSGFATNSNPAYPAQQTGDAVMLDDRWSSFMHSYSILAEPGQPVNQPHQLTL